MVKLKQANNIGTSSLIACNHAYKKQIRLKRYQYRKEKKKKRKKRKKKKEETE